MERFNTSVLDGFAAAVAAVGSKRFEAALLAAIGGVAIVDHLTLLTLRPGEGLSALGIASRTGLSVARSLTRDYVATHHVQDPNYAELAAGAGRRRVLVRRHDRLRVMDGPYEARFYTTVGIVDKIAFLWQAAEGGYFVNLYRTRGSGPYSRQEAARLAELASFVAALVRRHGGRRLAQARSGGDLSDLLPGLLSDQLTKREAQVVAGILKGLRTEGIAIELGVKAASVITFRKRAYAKLGIATQAELFAACLRALPRG